MKYVLIIDDEIDILESLGSFLRRHGYGVLLASTGVEGLEMAKQEGPDLVILDLILPDLEGSEVAARMLECPATRSIPVIFLTSMMRKEEQLESGGRIANRCFVAKPCQPGEILKLVSDHIGPPV